MSIKGQAIWGFGAVAALAAVPLFLTQPYYLHTVIMILFYAFLASSWNIVGGFAGQLSLGHSAYAAIGGYTSTLLFIHTGLTPWVGMLVGGLIAAIIAVLVGMPTFRLRGAYYALATVAFAEGFRVILESTKHVGKWDTGGAEGLMVPLKGNMPSLMQFMGKAPYYYVILGMLVLVVLVSWYIDRSKLGYYLTALREDEEAAQALGSNTAIAKLQAAAISAFFTALGGTFYAQLVRFLEPPAIAGADLSSQMVLLAIVGGRGTVLGPVLGGVLLTTLGELTRAKLGGSLLGIHLILYGIGVMVAILYKPQGLIDPLMAGVRKLARVVNRSRAAAETGR
ncbi:MAG TPA: branched-chain amino acid ABC transporter permease [Symbiobacteriaceae bacterium]|nr:branched-chain amino acid ABC transporter permease [Symbiobacteriaceae bacterium]